MITEAEVRAIAEEEITKLCDAAGIEREKYQIVVCQPGDNPRCCSVYWDVIQPNAGGLCVWRSTGVDIAEDASVLRGRIRQIFAENPRASTMFSPRYVNIPTCELAEKCEALRARRDREGAPA